MSASAETKVSLQSETSILSESMLGEAYHHEGQKKYIRATPQKEITQKDDGIEKIK
ncbi:MAG TPA: hypothetical protein VJ894_04660 [Cryomorphaceae bacterium]|nr:hypothetical protein [Cryomorphaceae bacterium]